MAGKSDYLENKFLDYVLSNAATFNTANVFVGLFTATPLDSGVAPNYALSPIEVSTSGTAYARMDVDFSAASGGSTSNSGSGGTPGPVTFPTATGIWGTVTHFAIFDNVTVGVGNMLYFGSISPSKTIQSGDTASFAAGALTVTED